MRRAVTIKHVAAEAGVSLQTVSRVINNGPNVRPAVAERVRAAVAKLGYVPSVAARGMGGSRSFLLMALNDRDRTIDAWTSGQGSDWVDQMLMGGMLRCAESGYHMIFELIDTHAAQVEREVQSAISALRPDGVILTPPHSDNPQITDLLVRLGLPFARMCSDAEGAGYAISMDEALAAQVATEHLLDLGHRRVGFITGSDEYAVSASRLEGWRRAHRERGLPVDPALEGDGDFTYASGERAATALLDLAEPPTAVLASNDQMALATMAVAARRGLQTPRDLSVVSFDDTPVVRFSHPPLTAVVQPIADMTRAAADLLIRAKGGTKDLPTSVVVPFGLAVRGSSAPPPR